MYCTMNRQEVKYALTKAATLSKRLIKTAIQSSASDIHFIPQQEQVFIFLRCHGERQYQSTLSHQQYLMMLSYYKYIGKMDIGESRKPQQGVIYYEHNADTYSLRLSLLPTTPVESLAIRLLPQKQMQTLPHLFLFPFQLQQIQQWLQYRSGLLLLTGATGTGKSTLLYALLKTFMEQNKFQTITLEDPVEKQLDQIIQIQINERAGVTYDAGLKAALRHDPDIIMVGEIRDAKTAQFAFRAASTGHLVLSTLHANDGKGTIHRLVNMGITPLEIDHHLLAVASMKLLSLNDTGFGQRRAAIMELLEREQIHQVIADEPSCVTPSFQQLKRKAFAYGFTNYI